MSTLPVVARLGPEQPNSLVPRRVSVPAGSERTARTGTLPVFPLDDPREADSRSPVVVISVNVVRPSGSLGDEAIEMEPVLDTALSRVLNLSTLMEPYARFGQQDRGTLVDQYA